MSSDEDSDNTFKFKVGHPEFMTLLINDEDFKKTLTFEDTLEALESAYRQYGRGLAAGNSLKYGNIPPPRIEIRAEGKDCWHMSPQIRSLDLSAGYLQETGMAFLRWGFHLGNRKGNIAYLIDAKSGEILAIIKNPRYVQRMRTGVEGAVGAKYLSRANSKIAGVIGTGTQGKAQLEYLCKVRKIEKAFAHSGRRNDPEYAREMSRELGIEVVDSDRIEEVVRKADILITATQATSPIVKGEWIKEGLHINAIGADDPLKVELDASVLKKASKIVIDDSEIALDSKEIRVPMEQGTLTMKNIYGTIGEVVAGVKAGRETPSEITIYKSVGSTIPYVTIFAKIYEKAKKMGLGKEVGVAFVDQIYS